MVRHRYSRTDEFVNFLKEKGEELGFLTQDEYPLIPGLYVADLVWKIRENQPPLISFEIETHDAPYIFKNTAKYFGTSSEIIVKPWYLFLIVLNGKLSRGNRLALQNTISTHNVRVFEDVSGNEKERLRLESEIESIVGRNTLFYTPITESSLTQLKSDITIGKQQDPLDIFLARDITNSPVITTYEDTAVNDVARLMDIHEMGCLVVVSKEGNPVGIITEGDLATRLLARNSEPRSKKTAKDVMTSPLITTEPEVSIRWLANMMSRLRIGKIGVVYKGQLVGIISQNDIVTLLAKMTEILEEAPQWTRQ